MQVFIIKSAPNSSNSLLILAKINENSPAIQSQNQGSLTCRQLLQQLFFANANDFKANFDETDFPYKLKLPKNLEFFSQQLKAIVETTYLTDSKLSDLKIPTDYYVSFSHSQKRVAILLSYHANLGVDIEEKIVSAAVSQRYFLPNEIDWVQSLPITEQVMGRKLLWTLKESLIKAQSGKDSQLIAGLKINLLDYMTLQQMNCLIEPKSANNFSRTFHQIIMPHYTFGFSPQWQCGFYLAFG